MTDATTSTAPSSLLPFPSSQTFGQNLSVLKDDPTTSPRILSINDFDIIKLIGKGASGQVYLVRDLKTNEKRAMKVIPKAGMRMHSISSIRQEQAILRLLTETGSPWFLKLDASFHDTRNFYLIFVRVLRRDFSRTNVFRVLALLLHGSGKRNHSSR